MPISYEKNRYIEHRENSMRRGIPFLLTFEQWWKIWQDSGHWHERGCHADEYVMARHNDVGSYSVDNVKIITWTQNIQEREISEKQRKSASERAKNLVFTNEMRRKISESKQGENNFYAKLTAKIVIQIRNEYVLGYGNTRKLAKKFGVSGATISNIIHRKTWRHI